MAVMARISETDAAVTELQAQLDWAEQHTGFAKRAAKGVETKTSFRAKVCANHRPESPRSHVHSAEGRLAC